VFKIVRTCARSVPHVHGHKRSDDGATGWSRHQWSTGRTAPTRWRDAFWVHRCQQFWSDKLSPAEHSRRCSRPGWGLANSAATVSEVWSQVSAAPVSMHVEFGTFAFNMVRWWRKLGEVENECNSHIFGSFAIFLPKIIKIGGNLRQFWQKQICLVFFETQCIWQCLNSMAWLCSQNIHK